MDATTMERHGARIKINFFFLGHLTLPFTRAGVGINFPDATR